MSKVLLRCSSCGALHEQGTRCKCSAKVDKKHNDDTRCYKTSRWVRCRNYIQQKLCCVDIWELGLRNELVTVGKRDIIIHHIIERDEDYSKFYDEDNLVSLSLSNHSEVHTWYNESPEKKKRAQELLRLGLKRFKEVMG